jgi:nucleotide-binding universal stress UspA family protein
MFRNILVAYDGSEATDNALEYACVLARRFSATIDVVSVVHRPLIGDNVELTAEIDQGIRRAERAITRLRNRTRDNGIDINFQTLVGQPEARIVARAESIDADLIVMGCRGVSAIDRWLTESTVRQVMGRSQRAMLIVR